MSARVLRALAGERPAARGGGAKVARFLFFRPAPVGNVGLTERKSGLKAEHGPVSGDSGKDGAKFGAVVAELFFF